MQTVIVIVILAATALFVVRGIVRTIKEREGGCGCGCRGCPYRGECNNKEADT